MSDKPEWSLRGFCRWVDEAAIANDSGGFIRVEPFQKEILRDYFKGARELFVLLPKGNGKTTLLALLALHHLQSWHAPDAFVPVAAAGREQAEILFRAAEMAIHRSETLTGQYLIKSGLREIWTRDRRSRIKIFASSVTTADGVIPTLAIIDELHRHRSPELLALWRDGLSKRDGQLVGISTAGSDPTSPLGQMRAAALKNGRITRRGGCVRAEIEASRTVWREWALDDHDNLDDMRRVKRVNPASWMTVERLRQRRASPTMTDSQWARFACNVWTADDEAAVPLLDWRESEQAGLRIPPGTPVWLGADFAWKRDTTALAPVAHDPERADGVLLGAPWIFEPRGDGRIMPEGPIRAAIEEASRLWPIRLVLDPAAGGRRIAEWAEDTLGIDAVIHSQSATAMADAASTFLSALGSDELRHPGDPALTDHVMAAAMRTVGEGGRFVKNGTRPIDAIIAAAMALRVMRAEAKTGKPLQPFVIAA